jgi:hypothetical protein
MSHSPLPSYDHRRSFDSGSLDKAKYWEILRTQGLSAAISELHREKEQLEFATFESEAGYRPELFQLVQEYCDFSRELWDSALNAPDSSSVSG